MILARNMTDLSTVPQVPYGAPQERIELGAADWRFPLPGGVCWEGKPWENHGKMVV